MVILNSVPLPLGDPISQVKRSQFGKGPDPLEGTLTQPWIDYLSGQAQRSDDSPVRIFNVEAISQSSDITATDMTNGGLSSGLYRISAMLHTTATDPGGTFDFVLNWQTEGATLSFAPATVGAAALTDYGQWTVFAFIDALSPVNYAVTYNVGLGGGRYSLWITLEQVKA